MLFGKITGLEKKISKIILGNDKQKKYTSALKLWDSYYENVEKREKAEELSNKYNCSLNDIALSWVIDQKFPSYAIIGPKNKTELRFSMNSLNIMLSDEDKKWLSNLKQ